MCVDGLMVVLGTDEVKVGRSWPLLRQWKLRWMRSGEQASSSKGKRPGAWTVA